MEIDKVELQTMMGEFWSIDNNPVCEASTIIFLRRIGLTDNEIKLWIDLHKDDLPEITEEDKNHYEDKLQETKDYYKEWLDDNSLL